MTFAPDSAVVADVVPAANVEARRTSSPPSLLVVHYTGMSSAARAIDWLARVESGVSCHYVVDDVGHVTQMVPEAMRAWHAGVSCWKGERDINSHSIGIEIQNPGHEHGYPAFSKKQMRGVIDLMQDIVRRRAIAPAHILAHSDVAIGRKIDPGEKFDWALLAREGIGRWVRPSPLDADDEGLTLGATSPDVAAVLDMLASYGYAVDGGATLDASVQKAIRAFQLHFRPKRADGRLDRSTLRTLERLCAA
ncbi:MAG: N-acetylmuramoyl-L-alanine amidase, partial [Hyphomicrobium sp.]